MTSIQTDSAFADNTVPQLREGHPEKIMDIPNRANVSNKTTNPDHSHASFECVKAAPEGSEPYQGSKVEQEMS